MLPVNVLNGIVKCIVWRFAPILYIYKTLGLLSKAKTRDIVATVSGLNLVSGCIRVNK